uniref:Uncharacterized protein n=1 Tax=Anopheles atroparvus TaxID=41427 RepID=A0AAG5DSS0_ANOAO
MWTNTNSTKRALNTITFVILFCSVLPFFVISYTTVAISRQLWLIILFRRYPWLKKTNIHGIKSFVDRSRKPEVLCVLMEMEGALDIVKLREEFMHHISDCSSTHMRLCLPQFILPFVSCWNKYSWLKGTNSADEHIILTPSIQRGRSVKELMCLINNTNTNSTASGTEKLITKSKPALPWQIVCIPVIGGSNERNEKCIISNYLLYTIDLELLSEAEKRNLEYIPSNGYLESSRPLFDSLIDKPYYIPRLWNYIFCSIQQSWNEFVYQHDPLESPDYDQKKYAGIGQLLSAVFISIVYVCGDFCTSFRAIKGNPLDKIDYLQRLIEREIDKRNLTMRTIWATFLLSIEPVNLLKECIFLLWKIVATFTLMLPWYTLRETEALILYTFKGTVNHDTILGFFVDCFPICCGVMMECWRMMRLLVQVTLQLNE